MSKPTAAQKRMWGELVKIGCIACLQDGLWTQPEIHHIKDYGYHNHDKALPLCPAHHRPTSGVTGVPNRHGNPVEFEEKYSTDEELFVKCMKEIKP